MTTLNQSNTKKTFIHLFNALLPIVCFYFFSQEVDVPWVLWLFAFLLVSPSLVSLKKESWSYRGYYSTLAALIIVILGSTFDLWNKLLSSIPPNSATHLLILLFSLLLVANLQIHLICFPRKSVVKDDKLTLALRGPSLMIALIISCVLTNMTLISLHSSTYDFGMLLEHKMLDRGIIPPLCLLLFYWGLFLLVGKGFLIRQRLVKGSPFDLDAIRQKLSDDKNFADSCWQNFENSYAFPRYINWAIPILGFIGTVLGISLATESLSDLLSTTESDFSHLLSQALSPLGIAFDTTLIALTLSVILTLLQTLLYRWEEKIMIRLDSQSS